MICKHVTAIAALLALTACSSRPRELSPLLAAAPAGQAAFEADVADCGQLLAEGKLNSEGRLASGAAGAAAGGATLAAGAAAASSAGLYGGMAVASATIVLLPFVALGGAYGLAKAKQKKKEAAIQRAMGGCLSDRGHRITGWKKGKFAPLGQTAAATK